MESKSITPNTSNTRITNPRSYVDKAALESGLTVWQIMLAGYLSMPSAHRPSWQAICGELGISANQYFYWRKHPKLVDLKLKITRFWFLDHVPDVLESLRVSALQGDTHAARTFLEYVTEFISSDSGARNVVKITNVEINQFITQLKEKEQPQ